MQLQIILNVKCNTFVNNNALRFLALCLIYIILEDLLYYFQNI